MTDQPSEEHATSDTMTKCPYCNTAPIQVMRKVWYMQGYVILARYGSKYLVGCRSCVDERVKRNLWSNLLRGWWSLPWGLGTPIVLVQNLLGLVTRPDAEEYQRLVNAGLRFSRVTT